MRGFYFGWLMAIIFVIGLCGIADAQTDADVEQVLLIVGQSRVVTTPWPTVRVAVTDPTIANVEVLTPQQVLVQGLKVGSTDLILWSEDEQAEPWQRRVIVALDIEAIRARLEEIFPTASLDIVEAGQVVVIRGLLRSADQAEQLHRYLEQSKIEYVDMTSVAGVQQVQLQVRVAEVSKAAIRQLGVNFIHTSEDFFFGQRIGGLAPGIGVASQAFLTPGDFDNLFFDTPGGGTSSAVTLFAGFPKADLEFFLQALVENQYVRLLANPTIVALSGEEASFLAGGEFPIPVPQSGAGAGAGGTTITIEYKEYGVRLTFRPIVLGDNGIRLHAAQEVSELTEVGSIRVQDYQVPALVTRRAEATLELKSGQSFAMAGLLRNKSSAINQRIPGLGDLPVLGPLFRSVQYRNEETELIILVTASLIEPMSTAQAPPLPGVTHAPPDDWELYIEGRLEGKEPAKLDPASAEWLREMGLDGLVGPGAWDSYEGMLMPPYSGETQQPTSGATTDAPKDKADKKLPWDQPSELPGM